MSNDFVTVVEVGPRDGLQNEKTSIDTADKIAFINQLSQTGLSVIEVTSFVSPKWVPQMADHFEVLTGIERRPSVRYPVLVPNSQGLERALQANAQEIAVFVAASETFSRKNTHCSIEDGFNRAALVIQLAKQQCLRVRGYVSCVLGCPYEGNINPGKVVEICTQLMALGCDEISLGDTIGAGTAHNARDLIKLVSQAVPLSAIAIHFHDSYGQALANILACLEIGVRVVDASIGGLGGCPYAPRAGGNVATEEVVYLLHGLGMQTGIDLSALIAVDRFIHAKLGRSTRSKVALAR